MEFFDKIDKNFDYLLNLSSIDDRNNDINFLHITSKMKSQYLSNEYSSSGSYQPKYYNIPKLPIITYEEFSEPVLKLVKEVS